jgi:hypothetical protein
MEPPRHDDFEPDRLPTDKERKSARLALREITKWVRDMLRRHAQDPVSEATSIDELKEFFADEAAEGTGGQTAEENPAGDVIIRARPLKRQERLNSYENSEDPSGEGELDADGDGEGNGGGDGTGGGGDGKPNDAEGGSSHGGSGGSSELKNGPAKVRLQDVRSIPLTKRSRRIAFTPDYSGNISVLVQDSGADSNYKLQIASASKGTILQGMITDISVSAGKRCMLEIELDSDFDGAMRVVADAV